MQPLNFSVGDKFEGHCPSLLYCDFPRETDSLSASFKRRTIAFGAGDRAIVKEVFDVDDNPAPCASMRPVDYPVLRLEINGEECLFFSAVTEWASYFRPVSALRLLAECSDSLMDNHAIETGGGR